jgi:hypothetical protein
MQDAEVHAAGVPVDATGKRVLWGVDSPAVSSAA